MKKIISIFVLSIVLFACNNAADDTNVQNDTGMTQDPAAVTPKEAGENISEKALQSSIDTSMDIGTSPDTSSH